MSKTMLVNVTHVEESRVAILEDGVLADYEIETQNRANIKGNIYNAVVENVIPSLEAAFVRLSGELKGFLPLDEVNFQLLPPRGEGRGRGKIGQHLHPGQRLMVQVVREPFGGKPPTVSTYFSLPGRYLVLMPGVDSAGVSRKIEDGSQRDRLKKLADELKPPAGFGLIVRTAGMGQTKTELQRDLRYLLRLWESVQRASRAAEFPGLVYRERDLVIRTIRDHFTADIDEVWIDNQEVYERALQFVQDVIPAKARAVKLYIGDRPLFNKFNLEEQIETIYKRRVPLPSGGEVVIDGTEALTAFDVNSARSSRSGDSEDLTLQTNLEAAREIARQLRLRDLGGLLVIDFIDMARPASQRKVEKAMRDALKGDKARWDVTKISKLGLMELARQRIKSEKMGASYATCPACEGYGLIKNVEAAALSALRKLQARCTRGDFGKMRMGLPPEVATWILNNKREDLVALERRHSIRIQVDAKAALRRHESEFETFPREKAEAPPALSAPDRPLPPLPPDMKEIPELQEAMEREKEPAPPREQVEGPDDRPAREAAAGAEEGEGRGRKRRRRRRRRGKGGEGAPVDARTGAPAPEEGEEPELEPAFADAGAEAGADAGGDEEFAEPLEASSDEEDEGPETEEAGEGAAAEGGPPDEGGGRRRRRRRRRRRGRGGAVAAQPQNGAPEGVPGDLPFAPPRPAPAPVLPEAEEVVVPRGIRSEELMPAAVGGRRQRGGGASQEGGRPNRPRRRRRGGGGAGGGNGVPDPGFVPPIPED